MQKLQLYVGTTRLDLFKDESVDLTQTIQNVKDIKKIFTEFTKTFSVPASSVNNKVFKHYYNFDISGGFDARIKTAASIELNGIPFKKGTIRLQGVDLKNNVAHTYRITFFGETINLKDVLGDDQLSELSDLDQYNQTYTDSDIIAALQNSQGTDGNIIAPLITLRDRMTYNTDNNPVTSASDSKLNVAVLSHGTVNGMEWNQFKYAIRLQAIIEAIEAEEKYDITFSDDFFDSTNAQFYNLYMWLHRKKGDVGSSDASNVNWSQLGDLYQFSCDNEDTITGDTFSCVANSYLNNGQVVVNVQAGNVMTGGFITLVPTVLTQDYSARVLRNGTQIMSFSNQQGIQTFGGNSSDFGGGNVIENDALKLDGTYILQIASDTALNFAADAIGWRTNYSNIANFFRVGTFWYKNQSIYDTSIEFEFNITEQIPKMTIISFLTGMFQMFNLTAYVDENNIIVVKTLDSYYAASSTTINIDQYLDTTKSTVNVALPFKEVNFNYGDTKTFLANQYEQVYNNEWGSLSYTLDNAIYDAPSESYEIKLPFEHLMYERLIGSGTTNSGVSTEIQYGYFVDDNQEAYYGKPLIFYPVRITSSTTPIVIRENPSTTSTLSNYFVPSNSLALSSATSTLNLNFNIEFNEYEGGNEFVGTLFETGYKTYIQDVFNENRRLTKVTAYLPMKIFLNLKLNDHIELGQNTYKINSLKTNLMTGKTDFELLNTIV